MSTEIKVFEIPAELHSLVRDKFSDYLKLVQQKDALFLEYQKEKAVIDAKYDKLANDLIPTVEAAKLQIDKDLCAAMGLVHDPDHLYTIDGKYMEYGWVFLVEYPPQPKPTLN